MNTVTADSARLVLEPLRVSLVVPLYNEEELVSELLTRTVGVLRSLPGGPHELLLVDDGSRDRTLELIVAAAQRERTITVISLSRNFGHQAALTAGIDHARGDVIAVMDGDLQDDPGMIPRFIELYHQGYDVIYAQRIRRKERWWLRAAYAAFYRLISRIADVPLPVDAGDFGLMSARVVRAMQQAPERNRFLRGLRAWAGFRQIGVPVERASRHSGQSKYSLWKLTRLAMDGIFAFSVIPIRLASIIGALTVSSAALYAVYALYVRLVQGPTPRGFTTLALLIIFLSGLILLFLGVIGEYVGRVYHEVKARPVYLVDRIIRGADGAGRDQS